MTLEQDTIHQTPGVSVHTGFPNPAIDERLRSLDLNHLLINHSASTYFFRVQGSEWESIGIFDGDIAIIDRALDASRNDIVLWWGADSGEFKLSALSAVPAGSNVWGVITATIHQFRRVAR
ncbi:MAG TPA: S24 family peptidase [Candidatus Saccharimonadales bacterium]|nr:S24 family peptidase [Candidatus Saccharimonadales bacterium]